MAAKPSDNRQRGSQFSLRGLIATTAAVCGTMAILGALQVSVANILLGLAIFAGIAFVLIIVAEFLNRVSQQRRGRVQPVRPPFPETNSVDWIAERREELVLRRESQEGQREDESSGGDPF